MAPIRQGEIMAVRKSVEDAVVVSGPRERWLPACKDALDSQGFTKVDVSTTLFQIKANYKKATVWGDLEVTLVPEGAGATKINAKGHGQRRQRLRGVRQPWP
jgi:hypothetical protein